MSRERAIGGAKRSFWQRITGRRGQGSIEPERQREEALEQRREEAKKRKPPANAAIKARADRVAMEMRLRRERRERASKRASRAEKGWGRAQALTETTLQPINHGTPERRKWGRKDPDGATAE